MKPPTWISSTWFRLGILVLGLAVIGFSLTFNRWSQKQRAIDRLAEDISWAIDSLLNRASPAAHIAFQSAAFQNNAFQIGANASNPVPAQAAKVGFIQPTFNSNFSSSTVDITNTQKPGFNWYPWKPYYNSSVANLGAIVLNSDGSVTLTGDKENASLATASYTGTPGGFVGSTFGGGGYFEATLKFNPQDVIKNNFVGWPSFWSMAREHLTQDPLQDWPGQVFGYNHFVEVDIFEYDTYNPNTKLLNTYGASVHDWSGVYTGGYANNIASPPAPSVQTVPPATNFTQFHKYGMLWVPATRRAKGYIKFYFDDAQIGNTVTWSQYTDEMTPANYSKFGIIDKQNLVLILGTGVGIPMTVRSVNVWQSKSR